MQTQMQMQLLTRLGVQSLKVRYSKPICRGSQPTPHDPLISHMTRLPVKRIKTFTSLSRHCSSAPIPRSTVVDDLQ